MDWHKWLKSLLIMQGCLSFIGAILYGYAFQYKVVWAAQVAVFLWTFFSLIVYVYLIFYVIFNAQYWFSFIKLWWYQEK